MEIDWEQVKKKTLWHYEKLIAKILDVLEYSFVQDYYAHDMREAGTYSEKIQQGYRHGKFSYLEVLDTERTLFNVELKQSELQQAYRSAYVNLYKALGGGWVTKAAREKAQALSVETEVGDDQQTQKIESSQ